MWSMWWNRAPDVSAEEATERIRMRYARCRELVALNNESLELLAHLQEDLQFIPPRADLLGSTVTALFHRAGEIVAHLESLTGRSLDLLRTSLHAQLREVERDLAARQELRQPRFATSLAEVGMRDTAEVGGKAATLAEIRRELGIPVPDGYVLTTAAYLAFFGVPYGLAIRDTVRRLGPGDSAMLSAASAHLTALVSSAILPRPVEVALLERAQTLAADSGLAIRSSAVGEGGTHSFAGQFDSCLNVAPANLVAAYKTTIASRFSARALSYRLSAGLTEVESPMAVLVLPTIDAVASGILYTRDPADPRRHTMVVSAGWGVGFDAASGPDVGDLFIVSRDEPHGVLTRRIANKTDERTVHPRDGLLTRRLGALKAQWPAIDAEQLANLAAWAIRIERHFGVPQDIEWALDRRGQLWILQARPLALAGTSPLRPAGRVHQAPLIEGGCTIYRGRVSGPAYVVDARHPLGAAPAGSVVFVRRAAPEIVSVCTRAAAVVAEWGSVTGHAAALLREFKVPAMFEVAGVCDLVRSGDPVSVDTVRPAVYSGALWRGRSEESDDDQHVSGPDLGPIRHRVLALSLHNPSSFNFRPSGCRSLHDVIRYCHEKAIEAMFSLNDGELRHGAYRAQKFTGSAPLDLHVLDLGGGLARSAAAGRTVAPGEITCRPFQALWRGITHPGVTWSREMPTNFGSLMSVMAGSLTSTASGPQRALGEKSYLLITSDYMDLNSRLAYHFTLVDALVGEASAANYVFFRFAGGGAAPRRRRLRAAFLDGCLTAHGFQVDRRGDLINAWFKKARAEDTEEKLDILGRLMACASQLDMYMTGEAMMRWYVQQFLAGNYSFTPSRTEPLID